MAKPKGLELTAEHRQQLEKLVKSGMTPVDYVRRARILLRKADGLSSADVAKELKTSRVTVDTWANRYRNRDPHASLISLISVAPGRGRKRKVVGSELNLVVRVACTKPSELHQPEEQWTITRLTRFLNEMATSTGEENLSTISRTSIYRILQWYDIMPWLIQYYCEKRDPHFDEKRDNILLLYKIVSVLREGTPEEKEALFEAHPQFRNAHFVSDDEKPGIQAIGRTAPDLMPKPLTQDAGKEAQSGDSTPQQHRKPQAAGSRGTGTFRKAFPEAFARARRLSRTIVRDYEYKRFGTVSLLAGIDLMTGYVHHRESECHKSEDHIELLKKMDAYYPEGDLIIVSLDNLSVHMSGKVKEYLAGKPGRFLFVFTPKHASWLNLIEIFFSKVSRCLLRNMSVKSQEELMARICQYIDGLNLDPVVFRWKWGLEDIDVTAPLQTVDLVSGTVVAC